MIPFPGALVTVWEGGELSLGVVAGEEKRRVRLVLGGGREIRVQPARIGWEVEAPGAVPGTLPEERKAAAERVEQAERRLARLVEQVDVPVLWQVVTEDADPDDAATGYEIGDLAELALESRSGEARAAAVRALRGDGLRFARKGDRWLPRSAQQVDDLILERQRIAERETQTQALFSGLRSVVAGERFEPTGSEYERRYLDALRQLAIHAESTPEATRGLAVEALGASGLRHDRPHEGAFRLLRSIGELDDDDVNLQVLRYGLRTRFPETVLEAAERAVARGFDASGREDLTAWTPLCIDAAHTREIDDAITIEPGSRGPRIGIHIAAPELFVEPGDPIDEEALARGLTHYHPDRRIKMLPPVISEDAASLVPGEPRPSLSFVVDCDETGEVRDWRIVPAVIRAAARIDYGEVDRSIATGEGRYSEELLALDGWARGRERGRVERGALSLHHPEVDVRVERDGGIRLERIEADSVSRRIVSEAMILAGDLAARYCVEHGIPVVYRRQPPPERNPLPPPTDRWDPIAVRRVLRTMSRAEPGLRPARHHGLGLDAYVQVTSPIRRFQDLTTGRQIVAHLTTGRPLHEETEIQRIAATTERAEHDARRAERASEEFWMLRYMERFVGQEVEGLVVESEPRPIVLLPETMIEQPMPSLRGLEPGTPVRLRVERVNPRAGLLLLHRVD